jgi:ribonuclease P protein component
VVSPLAVLYALPSAGSAGRLGVAAGRRLGTAVVRNRLRRRWREAVRRSPLVVPAGWDVVLVARAAARRARFADLQRTWTELLRRAGVSPAGRG